MGLTELTPSRVLDLNVDDGLPIVDAVILNPFTPRLGGIKLKGLIDTGSFITIIPVDLVHLLKLKEQGRVRANGIRFENSFQPETAGSASGHKDGYHAKFPVQISIISGGNTFVPREVFAITAQRRSIIIGRDLLQWFVLHYHGPGALNPGQSSLIHNPMAGTGFFEIGMGLARTGDS